MAQERESMRTDSFFRSASMSSTNQAGVKTSPRAETHFLDLTRSRFSIVAIHAHLYNHTCCCSKESTLSKGLQPSAVARGITEKFPLIVKSKKLQCI
jgi:hypothetical protein